MKLKAHRVFLVVIMTFSSHLAFSQYQISGKSLLDLRKTNIHFEVKPLFFSSLFYFSGQHKLPEDKDLNLNFSLPPSQIPSIYSYDELGMFCKFDVQLEKATRFPVKFRLGEVEAVDRKEGKWQFDNWN